MGLLNNTATYNAQIRADRRAAAVERRNTELAANEARVRDLFTYVTALDVTADGRRRTARDGSNNENKRGPKAKK
jgi:hypothetical protein